VPSIAVLGLTGHPLAPAWATAGGALLGVGAHLANALPDLEDDLATGVRGLPHRLGRPASTAGAAALLLGATTLLAYGPEDPGPAGPGAVGVAAALTAAGATLGRRPGSRAPFLSAVAVAVVDVALLVTRGARLGAG
jgi:4-hydroxybenzoate polyprenyltransferase